MSFDIGATVGAYEIGEKLGQGGMATVYKAYHAALDRHVAIKVLHPALKEDESFLRRFTREARVVARLEHPHIVSVYDFAEHEGYPYLVMRYVEGETLKERLSQGALSRSEILRIATAVAEALDYAHRQGVLHRDVKPSNVLLTAGGGVYITDFGLARIVQAGESTLSQGMIMGTPQYISPEQAKGNEELDGRTDVYSFGIVLYEMVTGQVPFQSDTAYSIIHAHIFDPPPKPSAINDKIGPEMEDVLLKALSKEPGDRYATAGRLMAAFRQAISAMPGEVAPSDAPVLADYTPVAATNVAATEAKPAPEATPEPEPTPAVTPATAKADVAGAPAEALAEAPARRPSWLLTGLGALLVIVVLAGIGLAVLNSGLNSGQGNGEAEPGVAAREETKPPPDIPAEGEELPPAVFVPGPGPVRAVEEIEAQLEADPENPQLRAELAAAYMRDGRPDEARRLVRDTVREIRLPIGYIAVAERLLETDNLDLAETVLEEGLSRFNNNPDLQQLLMMTYIMNQRPAPQIEELIERLLQRPHEITPVIVHLGEAYLSRQRGDVEEAIHILNDGLAIENNPYRSQLLYLQGLLFLEMGFSEDALGTFEEAFRHDPPPWLAGRLDAHINELNSR